ncbi:MAG TPA: hypothetical protein VLQ65_09495 [Saliniramus sp.]|nr:hypothetical protein [Saliniramus sp.]
MALPLVSVVAMRVLPAAMLLNAQEDRFAMRETCTLHPALSP